MTTSVRDNRESERFEVYDDYDLAGVAQYRLRGDRISSAHTEIEPRRSGHGLGRVLVRAALDDVRGRGLAVLPYRPFVRGYIASHGEEHFDLVPSGERARFDLDEPPEQEI